MTPLLLVIVTFGLVFVVTASLAQGFSLTTQAFEGTLSAHKQLNVMLLISNFILMPALLIGITSLTSFNPQVKMAIIVLAVTAGAPFIPWLVSRGKGDLMYSVAVSLGLLLVTLVVLPFALPPLLRALNTGASPSVWTVAWPMLLFILVPLVIGVICRARYPELVAEVSPWLGPISLTFLVVHVSLYIGYSWSEFLSLAGGGQMAFTLAFPFAGLLIGYLLSPPYVLSPIPAKHPERATKLVSAVAVAQQNTGAVICCAIVPLGKYVVAGDYMLLGAIVTIVVVFVVMLEAGKRVAQQQVGAAASPAPARPPVASPPAPVAQPVVSASSPLPAR
jgi:BASS family bile acid:Na+ symporter